ncbi:MAG TPA: hypothetical protein RMH99_06555 [Sandaracinaceae bacterium LLY-WYZ-13_1]|nr:hypothetical protein [Sandaracinaceae bacterium LLY-WYZ-13_1]
MRSPDGSSPRGRRVVLTAAAGAALSAALVLASEAGAVSTERFVLDDAESLAAGDLIRTAVHSDGRVTAGVELARLALPDDVPVIYSLVRASDGTVYLGTGNEGRIYRLRGEQLEPFAETGQLLVSSLALGDGGDLYAGTLPEGRVYRVGADGQARELARPDDVEHVWALAWDGSRNTLFAGTGPEGRVYAIDLQGRAQLWWDSDAGHVMSLALGDEGVLYAGTSDEAVVARLTGPGRAEIVHDFEGNEITALDYADGVLAVGANEFPDPPRISRAHAKRRSASAGRAPRPQPGEGHIWRVGADGRAERLFGQDEGHITSVQVMDDGTIYGGTGHEGRVIRVNPDRTHATWIDVDERQVLAIAMGGDAPLFVTGDGAAIYRIVDERPANAIWESKVLDARFSARWGQLTWRAQGALVFQTRSGNTETPDETWSEWSSDLTDDAPVRSPRGRFLQVRARFERDPDAVLRAVSVYFLPQNQRPVVTDVRLEGDNEAATKKMRAERQDFVPDPSAEYDLEWDVRNPDGDRLRYRLHYRREDQSVWRDMLGPGEELTDDEYEWNTASIPDGWYVVRVTASDEPDNPADLVLTDARESEPIRIDNHAPRIEALRRQGTRLTGRAVDTLGPIARLEVAIDGGEWRAIFPTDDLFDTAREAFEIDLSALDPGSHIVAVRATDAAGNVGSGEAQITR